MSNAEKRESDLVSASPLLVQMAPKQAGRKAKAKAKGRAQGSAPGSATDADNDVKHQKTFVSDDGATIPGTPLSIQRWINGHEEWGKGQIQSMADWIRKHESVGNTGIARSWKATKTLAARQAFAQRLSLCRRGADFESMEQQILCMTQTVSRIEGWFNEYQIYDMLKIPSEATVARGNAIRHLESKADPKGIFEKLYYYVHDEGERSALKRSHKLVATTRQNKQDGSEIDDIVKALDSEFIERAESSGSKELVLIPSVGLITF